MKGGGDGRLRRLTNFFINALFISERTDRGLYHPDAGDPEECNESIEVAKKNIMKLPARYGVGLTEKGMGIYIDKITKHFHDDYSDDLLEYPRVDDNTVNNFVKESIDESSVAGAGKSKKKKKATKKKATKKKATKKGKKHKKKKPTKKKGKLAGNPDCDALIDEDDCKSNSRCKWNNFEIRDFDMNTSKGREKLFVLKESLMKMYTKEELRKYLGSGDPSFFQVYMRAKKQYDNGLRGLCGNKMYKGSELSNMLEERVKKDYPDIKSENKSKKSKIPRVDKDLVEDLLKEAMKKNKPDKEIQSIIAQFDLHEKDLQRIYDKNNEQFSRLDKYLAPDQDEVSSLLGMVEDEVKLEKKEDFELQERLNRLKKSGKAKKTKKAKKAKNKAKK